MGLSTPKLKGLRFAGLTQYVAHGDRSRYLLEVRRLGNLSQKFAVCANCYTKLGRMSYFSCDWCHTAFCGQCISWRGSERRMVCATCYSADD